ncbi:MAG TPA: hypothetical protein VKE23_08280 [Candidatus Limnocylindria bacterium]|nr:hypothetical protein [Candidatus Limnocylindria bacterium]
MTGRVLGRDDWLKQVPLFVVVLAFVVTVDALVFVRITRSRRRPDRSAP